MLKLKKRNNFPQLEYTFFHEYGLQVKGASAWTSGANQAIKGYLRPNVNSFFGIDQIR